MKMLLSLLALVLSVSAFASSTDSQTFTYDGSQNSVELVLNAVKTHTEYRYENYQTTCSRTETYYRTYCEPSGTQRVCVNTPSGVVCHNRHVPGRCYQRPEYRTVWYPCTQTRTIPYEVKDYDVQARVIVDVTNLSQEVTTGENITVTLNGETLTASASGSKKFFIVQTKKDIRSSMNGSVKHLDSLVAINLVDATKVIAAAPVNGLSVSGNVLKVKTSATAEELANLTYSLKIEKKKLFGSDRDLINRELNASEIVLDGSEGQIDLSKLGVELNGGKFEITLRSAVKVNGVILNDDQFGSSLGSSKTLIFKN